MDRRLDPGDLVCARPQIGLGSSGHLSLADLAQPREEIRLDGSELLLVDLAHLEAHLRREQLLAQAGIVVQLGFRRLRELAEDELDPAHDHLVEDDHFSFARSSFKRMLTKLYGGHGPVYLNVSLSYLAPMAFTF